MKLTSVSQTHFLLARLGINISFELLEHKLLSHSDFPSLLSITDTLDSFSIENAAMVVDKERLYEIPVPFLAYTPSHNGEYILVENTDKFKNSKSDCYKNWNGVIIVAESPETFFDGENQIWLKKTNKKRMILGFVAAFAVAFFAISLLLNFSLINLGIILTILAGLIISVLIIQHELGYDNKLTNQLCSISDNVDCNAVLNFKGSLSSKIFTLSDAPIIYFTTSLLLFVISSFSSSFSFYLKILAFTSAITIPFTIYSLYYQKQRVKKWCTLCLLTSGILWLQFGLMVPTFLSSTLTNISAGFLLTSLFIFLLVLSFWSLIAKPLVIMKKNLIDKYYELTRFKNNPDIFSATLLQQRKAEIVPFENEIQLGNPEAPVQLVVGCALYCNPCAQTHELLEQILDSNDVGCTIRFYADIKNWHDKRITTLKYILRLLHNKSPNEKRKIMHTWYSTSDFEKFSSIYPLENEVNIDEQITKHENWCRQNEIKFTPTIFVNGYEFPAQYTRDDLPELINSISTKFKGLEHLLSQQFT